MKAYALSCKYDSAPLFLHILITQWKCRFSDTPIAIPWTQSGVPGTDGDEYFFCLALGTRLNMNKEWKENWLSGALAKTSEAVAMIRGVRRNLLSANDPRFNPTLSNAESILTPPGLWMHPKINTPDHLLLLDQNSTQVLIHPKSFGAIFPNKGLHGQMDCSSYLPFLNGLPWVAL